MVVIFISARYRIDRRKSFPRDANGLEPIEAYFSSEEDDTSKRINENVSH